MKTKKILSFALAAIMALSMSVTAFAETNNVTLTYKNEASYEISIPDSATINQSTGKGTIVVDINDAKLAAGTAVSVTIDSSNYDDGWYLVNVNNENDRLAYTIGTTAGGNDVASGDEVLSASDITSTTLHITVSDTSKVGTFTDIITFTSEMVDTLIDFRVDYYHNSDEYVIFQAAPGMTWAEWVDSPYNNSPQMTFYISSYGQVVVRVNGNDFENSIDTYTNPHLATGSDLIIDNQRYYASAE